MQCILKSTVSRPMCVIRRRQYNIKPSFKHVHVPRSSWAETAEVTSYFVGKGIILFTMFYCSMNWWHYKRMREEIEKENEKENKKKK